VLAAGLLIQPTIFRVVEKTLIFYTHEDASITSVSLRSRPYRVRVKAQAKIHVFCVNKP